MHATLQRQQQVLYAQCFGAIDASHKYVPPSSGEKHFGTTLHSDRQTDRHSITHTQRVRHHHRKLLSSFYPLPTILHCRL